VKSEKHIESLAKEALRASLAYYGNAGPINSTEHYDACIYVLRYTIEAIGSARGDLSVAVDRLNSLAASFEKDSQRVNVSDPSTSNVLRAIASNYGTAAQKLRAVLDAPAAAPPVVAPDEIDEDPPQD